MQLHWQQVAFGHNSWMHTPYMHLQDQPAAQHLSYTVNPTFFVPQTFPPVVTNTCLRPPPPPYFRPNIQNVCGETSTNIPCQSQIPNFHSNITPGPTPQEHSGNHYVRTSIGSETPVIQAQSANWQREQQKQMTPSHKESVSRNHNIPSLVDLATGPPIMANKMKSRERTFGMTRHSTPKKVRFSSVGLITQDFEKTLNPVP